MKQFSGPLALAFLLPIAASGCTSISSHYTGDITQTEPARIIVCHGFDCTRKSKLNLSASDGARFASIMGTPSSPSAERASIAKAVRFYEDRAAQAIGVRDGAKSDLSQSGHVGQMDCIDESTNTRSLLLYLEKRGLLRFHKVEWNVSRGIMVDGRYPHSTAVIHDSAGGQWAVDSWYEATGGSPDIMPLSEWKSHGVLGAR